MNFHSCFYLFQTFGCYVCRTACCFNCCCCCCRPRHCHFVHLGLFQSHLNCYCAVCRCCCCSDSSSYSGRVIGFVSNIFKILSWPRLLLLLLPCCQSLFVIFIVLLLARRHGMPLAYRSVSAESTTSSECQYLCLSDACI